MSKRWGFANLSSVAGLTKKCSRRAFPALSIHGAWRQANQHLQSGQVVHLAQKISFGQSAQLSLVDQMSQRVGMDTIVVVEKSDEGDQAGSTSLIGSTFRVGLNCSGGR